MSRIFMIAGGITGALSVGLGAFGAHTLKEILTPDRLEIYQTGVHYLMIHSLVLIVCGWLGKTRKSPFFNRAGTAILIGMVFFSGSLVALSLTGFSTLGAVAPIGGLSYLVGWLLLGFGAFKSTG